MPVQQLPPLPVAPSFRGAVAAKQAWRYLEAGHATVAGVLDSLSILREAKRQATGEMRGRLTNDETNLLRAAIVFTSSGLDTCLHRLVNDCTQLVVARDAAARSEYHRFRTNQLDGPMEGAVRDAILSLEPSSQLLAAYTEIRTKGSYQKSSDILSRVKGVLAISTVPREQIKALDPFFKSRNAIVHDLDFKNPKGTGGARHPRMLDPTAEDCGKVFTLCSTLILATMDTLRKPPLTT